jgi:hypothetical protein
MVLELVNHCFVIWLFDFDILSRHAMIRKIKNEYSCYIVCHNFLSNIN